MASSKGETRATERFPKGLMVKDARPALEHPQGVCQRGNIVPTQLHVVVKATAGIDLEAVIKTRC